MVLQGLVDAYRVLQGPSGHGRLKVPEAKEAQVRGSSSPELCTAIADGAIWVPGQRHLPLCLSEGVGSSLFHDGILTKLFELLCIDHVEEVDFHVDREGGLQPGMAGGRGLSQH